MTCVNLMVEYVVKHQNNYVYTNLFQKNIVQMMIQGITLTPLLDSEIFLKNITFNEWPEKSALDEKYMVPYNESKLTLRYKYPQVFSLQHQEEELERQQVAAGTFKSSGARHSKLKFELNMLLTVDDFDGNSIMEALADCEELDVFTVHTVKDMIDYKFNTFAYKIHRIGFAMHVIYVLMLLTYIIFTFLGDLDKDPESGELFSYPEPSKLNLYCVLVCLVYPTLFDGNQLAKSGMEYFEDPWNYIDIVHIFGGYLNVFMQLYVSTLGIIS
jgi:hypothetical protein